MLECAPPTEWKSLAYGTNGFKEVIRSVVDRFHPGLILFILRKIEKWSTRERYKPLYAVIGTELRGCLNREENLRNLSSAFVDPSKCELARELIRFVDVKFVPFMANHLKTQGQEAGLKPLLTALLAMGYKIEDEFFKWPEDLITSSLGALVQMDFPQRAELLSRALRNRSAAIRQEAVKYVAYANLDAAQSMGLF
jgi:hypothetical protein